MESKLVEITGPLRPQFAGRGECVHLTYSGGVFLCAFHGTSGGAVWIPEQSPSSVKSQLESFLEVCVSKLGSSPQFKMVGSAPLREEITKEITARGFKLLGQGDVKSLGLNLYFLPELGKIRIDVDSRTVTKTAIPRRKKRVMIVDDSGTMRKVLRQIFESDPALEVVAETGRPSEAENLVAKHEPDVVTLDIHMPEMDGITLLKKLHAKFPIPYVMISSVSQEEGVEVLKALEHGAVDYIEKPSFDQIDAVSGEILEKIKAASEAKIVRSLPTKKGVISPDTKMNVEIPILIGSSTGGTEALRELLIRLPKQIPPILIVQHIPAVFSLALATRLNEMCPFEVREAQQGDTVKPGLVLIAPGGQHMTVRGSGRASSVVIQDGPAGYRHKPAVDVLFDSAVNVYGANCKAIILTGMGDDGAKGMLKLKKLGVETVAQDEKTCVVYGMPRCAVELGAVDHILPLDEIPNWLVKTLSGRKKSAA